MSSTALRIISLHEREIRLFPREDLFDATGRPLLLSATRKLSAVELREAIDGVELRALGLIGYLPITTDIVLNLQPKFPTKNLWRMLALANETYNRVLPVLRTYERANDVAPHQMLAKGFCHYLREILIASVARGYYPEEYHGHYKPKIHFGRTMARYLSKGDAVSVSADTFAFSSKLKINGLLKSACLSFLRLIPSTREWAAERALLLDALSVLEFNTALPMNPGEESLALTLVAWLRNPYYGALSIYAVMLGFTKIGFAYEPGGAVLPSFLFKLDDIFESFVRNTFRIKLRSRAISVLDGNSPKNHIPLFIDNRQYPTKPDVIFRREKKLIALAEVKYKPRIEESDRYQLISHVAASRAPLGVWVSPVLSGEATGLRYVGSVAGAKFYHYTLDISAQNFDSTLDNMTDDVYGLFSLEH